MSLCYLPTAGRLTLTIVKARNLKAMDITGASGKSVIFIKAFKLIRRLLTLIFILTKPNA